TVAVGGSDTFVLVWDIRDPAHPERIGEPITGPPSRIYDLAFDPRGEQLLAAVIDGTAWLWDTRDLTDVSRTAVLGPFDGPTFAVAVSPDGSVLSAGGGDQQIHLWSRDEEAVIDGLCARVGDPMTRDEWATHVPDEPFERIC